MFSESIRNRKLTTFWSFMIPDECQINSLIWEFMRFSWEAHWRVSECAPRDDLMYYPMPYMDWRCLHGAAESIGRLIAKNERTVREWRLLHTKRNPVRIEGVISKSSVTPALIKYPKECNPVAWAHLNSAISTADCTCFINLLPVQYPSLHVRMDTRLEFSLKSWWIKFKSHKHQRHSELHLVAACDWCIIPSHNF